MVNILPFRAIHYNFKKIPQLSDVITPPYDQISEALQEKLYERHPYNFIRLILGKTFSADTQTNNRYTRAAADLSAWLQEKILVQEEEPCLFACEQNFILPDGRSYSRLGIIGILRLEPLGKKILPHEKTFPKPKTDRLQLMRACRANFEHVFFLADDPENQIHNLLSPVRQQEPFASCRDDTNILHALWKISGKESIREIQSFFENRTLLIADGHHRYETSLAYEQESANPNREASSHFRLGTFISFQDPGLVILPTHRILRDLSEEEKKKLTHHLEDFFWIQSFPDAKAVLEEMKKNRKTIGLIHQSQCRLLQWRDSNRRIKKFSGAPPALRNLNVFLLHHFILDRILEIPETKWAERIAYVRWPEEAIREVESNPSTAAFFLNPVNSSEIMAVSQAGTTMPQKSTDFYPKLASGLLFYLME